MINRDIVAAEIEKYINDWNPLTDVFYSFDLADQLREVLLKEIKYDQPHKVTCAECGNNVSYGKRFDPVAEGMLLVIQPCKCGE